MASSLSSYLYKFSERILTHATTFVVSIVLARLLTPEDYGTLAILLVFVTLAQVFIEGGLGSSLVQKQDVTEQDYNITLTITLGLSLILYGLLFCGSNSLESWFEMDGLSSAFKVIGLVLFPSSYLSVIKARYVREMKFKIQMYVTFVSSLISGGLGIVLAYNGSGIWALIAQQLSNTLLLVVLFSIIARWLPKIRLRVNIERAKSLYNYGYKIMLTNLLVRGNNEILSLAIGKQFSKASLGLYDRGKQFPQAAAENIEGTVASVLFPILSRCQNDKILVKEKTRRMQAMGASINFFIMPIVAGSAPTYIPLLLTDKWLGCIPLLLLWVICYIPSIYIVISTTAINAVGNSDMTLKRQLFTTIPTLLVLLMIIPFSTDVVSVMIVKAFSVPYVFYITARYLSKSIGYKIKEQLIDQLPYFLLGCVVFVIVYLENYLKTQYLIVLLIQGISSLPIYLLLSHVFRLQGFEQLKSIVLSIKK